MTNLKGKFIVFDGNEGCGKSTQARLLHEELSRRGVESVVVRDPGTTRIGEMIRQILLDPENTDIAMRCEMLLYMAARAQMLKQIIQPALAAGKVVISDRFVSSTLAYQLGGDGLSEAEIMAVGEVAVKQRWPDLVVILDLPVDVSSARAQPKFVPATGDLAAAEKDRIELRSREYHQKVRENFLRQAQTRKNYRVVDSNRPPEIVHAEILKIIDALE
jgi:dTMP kinase